MDSIEAAFKDRVSSEVTLEQEGNNRYRVSTPFQFEDGDQLVILLKRISEEWILSDEAHTFMRLTYDIDESDLGRGKRQEIISQALSVFEVEDRDGELLLPITDERYGDALFSFIQAILKISNVTFLSRERVRSTFREDFMTLVNESVASDRLSFDWFHPVHDPQGMYRTDCRINGTKIPLLVHALNSDGATRDATISLLQYEKWKLEFRSLAIFEDQAAITRHVLARFSDVADKQFSSIGGNRERIVNFLSKAIAV
ncbi:MAG: DUF1828 domain-containing protein [bacterium]|nr:DUF1828 domain-containing protein [bacterium]